MLHGKLILFSTSNRHPLQLVKLNDERRFPYSSYKRKCFMCVETSNTKNEKDNPSCSKQYCQICGKNVCRKHALRICEYCNNNAN